LEPSPGASGPKNVSPLKGGGLGRETERPWGCQGINPSKNSPTAHGRNVRDVGTKESKEPWPADPIRGKVPFMALKEGKKEKVETEKLQLRPKRR